MSARLVLALLSLGTVAATLFFAYGLAWGANDIGWTPFLLSLLVLDALAAFSLIWLWVRLLRPHF